MLLFAEFSGSGVQIRGNIIITAGTNLSTRVCPGTPGADLSPVIQEHTLLIFGAQPPSECSGIVLTLVSSFYVIHGLYRAVATCPQQQELCQAPLHHSICQGLTSRTPRGWRAKTSFLRFIHLSAGRGGINPMKGNLVLIRWGFSCPLCGYLWPSCLYNTTSFHTLTANRDLCSEHRISTVCFLLLSAVLDASWSALCYCLKWSRSAHKTKPHPAENVACSVLTVGWARRCFTSKQSELQFPIVKHQGFYYRLIKADALWVGQV